MSDRNYRRILDKFIMLLGKYDESFRVTNNIPEYYSYYLKDLREPHLTEVSKLLKQAVEETEYPTAILDHYNKDKAYISVTETTADTDHFGIRIAENHGFSVVVINKCDHNIVVENWSIIPNSFMIFTWYSNLGWRFI